MTQRGRISEFVQRLLVGRGSVPGASPPTAEGRPTPRHLSKLGDAPKEDPWAHGSCAGIDSGRMQPV